MKLLQNKGVAWACALIMILGSVFGLGGSKLSHQREIAETAFFQGQNGFSPYDDLTYRRELSANILRIAEAALPKNDKTLRTAESAWNAFSKAETPEEYYETNSQLQKAIDELYDTLSSAQLSENDKNAAYRQYTDFCGRQSNLTYDDYYNDLAKEYNEVCGGFPTAVIAGLTKNGKLPVFS